MKIIEKEVPHERTTCLSLIVKYAEKLNKATDQDSKDFWEGSIIEEARHLI